MRKKKIPASCYECDHVRIDADTKELLCEAAGIVEKRKDRRGIRKAAVMALALMLLTGCEEPLQDMEVVDKIYEPQQVIMWPQLIGTVTIMVPQVIGEEYVIVIQGTDSEGHTRELRRTVTRDEFEEIMVGDKLEQENK